MTGVLLGCIADDFTGATDLANKVFIAALILLIGWIVLLAANLSADHYIGRFQIGAPDALLRDPVDAYVRDLMATPRRQAGMVDRFLGAAGPDSAADGAPEGPGPR